MTPLLNVKDLNVRFKTQGQLLHAVRGIDFSLYEGESLGIVGESGCGKSATAKALVKLLPSFSSELSGEITYQNQNLLEFSEAKMRGIRGKEMGMIFQDPMTSLNPTIKIGDQITEGYRRHFPQVSQKQARDCAFEMLTKVGIPDVEDRMNAYPHTLSGGMRQRAMIALALACKPKILLADEPTTALDVTIQAQILDVLKGIQKETKTSMILITHDMSVVAHFCDRILVMYAGKIVESAPVNELFANPKHPYTKRLLQAIPRLNQPKGQPLVPIEGIPPNLSLPLNRCGFCSRCPEAMNVCATKAPPLFSLTATHASACFKHDPRCPC